MNSFLSFVSATAGGCRIYRVTSGTYVVSHERQPLQRLPAATLAGAYAACGHLERSVAGADLPAGRGPGGGAGSGQERGATGGAGGADGAGQGRD